MQKKTEITRSISKLIQFRNSHLFGFFRFYYKSFISPLDIFKPKKSYKKDKNAKKKLIFFFKFAKYICKKAEIIFQKKDTKKQKKKMHKNARGVYLFFVLLGSLF